MGVLGIEAYSMSIPLALRKDIIDYYSDRLSEANNLINSCLTLLLKKGDFFKIPNLPLPDGVSFVESQSFLEGLIGKKRPVIAQELASLYTNIQRNALGKATLIGFEQTAKSEEVKKFFHRGIKIAQKHITVFSSILTEENMTVPSGWEREVTDSTVPVFSDKMMMFHISSLTAISVGSYGTSLSTSPRRDLASNYFRFLQEVALYAEDGANILIDNQWMEHPPSAVDRETLLKGNKEQAAD